MDALSSARKTIVRQSIEGSGMSPLARKQSARKRRTNWKRYKVTGSSSEEEDGEGGEGGEGGGGRVGKKLVLSDSSDGD